MSRSRSLGKGLWEGGSGDGLSPAPALEPLEGTGLGQKHMQGHTVSSLGDMDYRGVKVK